MQFLNPEAFWALFLVALPIIIHLFNLRRIKKIYFSNLSFLKDVSQQRKSKTTLKKLLILACRVLALAFLVLAFARPMVSSDENGMLGGSKIIYLDNSLSLQRTDESGNTLLLNELSAAEGILNQLPKGSEVGLITNDKPLVRLRSVENALEELHEVDFSKSHEAFGDIYDKVERIQTQELLVFSDLQRSTILPLGNLVEDTSRKITFYALSSAIERNLYIDTVYLQKPVSVGTPNELSISIKNTDDEVIKDVLLKIFKEDQQLSSFSLDVPAEDIQTVTLEIGINSNVDGNYRVEINDSPVTFDNVFYFTINPVEKPLIVILSAGPTNSYLQKVYSNDEFFELITTNLDNTSFQDISRADLLVLDHLTEIPEWLLSQISNVSGDILVVPADNIDLGNYSALTGLSISRVNAQQSTISSQSLNAPFLEGVFNKKSDRMSMPDVKVRYDVAGYHRQLIKTSNERAFLAETGDGKAFMLTTPLLDSLTSFQKHALFVPVMYKIAQNSKQSPLSYRLNQGTVVLAVDSLRPQSIVKLVSETATFIPTYRYVEDRLFIELPEVLNTPGFYQLVTENDTIRSLAFNYDIAESEIKSISLEEFEELIAGNDHLSLESITDIGKFVRDSTESKDQEGLWKYALILALFFVISELLLLRFT